MLYTIKKNLNTVGFFKKYILSNIKYANSANLN